jgi:hypothetical protein
LQIERSEEMVKRLVVVSLIASIAIFMLAGCESSKKAKTEQALQAKAAQDKAAQDKAAADTKAAQDKAAQDKAAADAKAAQDKAAADAKLAQEKAAADAKAAQDKAAADAKAAQDKAAADTKVATQTQKVAIRVNCGTADGTQPYTDKDGNVWQPDRVMTGTLDWGAVDGQTIQRSTLAIQGDTKCPTIYQSETYLMSAYKFKVPNGKYTVKLHFAETYEGISGAGERVFSVSLNGKEILKDFDPFKAAGAFATPVVKKYEAVEPVDGVITIGFTANIENPQICGIEVLAE